MKQLLGATILPVIAAMSLPIWMMKLNYTVDNPWGIGLSKTQKTCFFIFFFFFLLNCETIIYKYILIENI